MADPVKPPPKLGEDFIVSCLAEGGKLQLTEGGIMCEKPTKPASNPKPPKAKLHIYNFICRTLIPLWARVPEVYFQVPKILVIRLDIFPMWQLFQRGCARPLP